MKPTFMQQEVLLTLHSSFAYSQLNKINQEENKNSSQEEKLEEACATGLIKELLPEVFKLKHAPKIYLWEMHCGFTFLELQFGELPSKIDKGSSIDPRNFLSAFIFN
jgi:hypothetical protein